MRITFYQVIACLLFVGAFASVLHVFDAQVLALIGIGFAVLDLVDRGM